MLAAPAPAQLLTGLLGNDTRLLVLSDTTGHWDSRPGYIRDGAGRPGPRLELESRYDDVFRERGDVRRNDVNRREQRANLETPLGPGHGRLRLTYHQVQTEIAMRPFADQSTRLSRNLRQLGLGYGRWLPGPVHQVALATEVTEVNGGWYPGYSLGLTTVPRYGVRLSFSGGRRIDGQTAVWRFEDQSFPGSSTYREDWLDLGAVWRPVDRLVLEASYGQGTIAAAGGQSAGEDIQFVPRLGHRSRLLGLRARPGDGRWGGGVRFWSLAAEGTGKFYDAGRQFGYLAEMEVSERHLHLWIDHRGPRGTLRLQFDQRQLTADGNGHMAPWPFGDNIFGQLYTIYFLDRAELSLDRLEFGYATGEARPGWDLRLGYILVKPANKLAWVQSLIFIFMGDPHQEELNLAAAELLVPSAAKTWRLGPAEFTYAFTQVIPIRVRLRREPAPGIPREKTRKRGGGYHRLKLTYDW